MEKGRYVKIFTGEVGIVVEKRGRNKCLVIDENGFENEYYNNELELIGVDTLSAKSREGFDYVLKAYSNYKSSLQNLRDAENAYKRNKSEYERVKMGLGKYTQNRISQEDFKRIFEENLSAPVRHKIEKMFYVIEIIEAQRGKKFVVNISGDFHIHFNEIPSIKTQADIIEYYDKKNLKLFYPESSSYYTVTTGSFILNGEPMRYHHYYEWYLTCDCMTREKAIELAKSIRLT